MKLQAKILLILAPLAVIPLLLLGLTTYSEITTNTRERTMETLEVLADETAKSLRFHISDAEDVARILADSKMLSKFASSTNVYEKYNVLMPSLVEFFAHYIDVYPEIITIRIRNVSGSNVLNVPEETPLTLEKIKTDTLWRDDQDTSFFYSTDNHPLFIHTVKLYKPDSGSGESNANLFGYLDVIASLEAIDEAIKIAHRNKYGIIFFTDQHGKVIRDASNLSLVESLNLPEIKDLISGRKEIAPQRIEFNNKTSYIQGQRVNKKLYQFSLLPHDQIVSSSESYFNRMTGIIVISVVLFTVLGFLSIKYLLIKPLQALGTAAQEIGEGNLSLTLDINNNDELGELSNSLKEMSHNLRQSNEQIRYFAYHDSLTKLPNRLMFSEYLNHALAHAKRHDQSLALMYLDLDDFKVINDTLGHQAGDEVLRELSQRLSDCLRADDYLGRNARNERASKKKKKKISRSETETVARLGGDEFTIFLPNINSPYEAATVANRVLESLEKPFLVENRELHVSASIGITTYPRDGSDVDTLIKNADMAMYHAKDKGKSAYSYYQESMNEAAFELLNLQNEMRKALERGEFFLQYQPQVDLNTGDIATLEALIRWQHPEKGLIMPDRFIPIAEQSELIVPIGEWVIQTACNQAKVWRDAGHSDLCVSVNVSPAQLHRHDIKEVIRNSLLSNALPAEALEIELTETTISNSDEIVFETLSAIKSLGVRIAMDDFGTGYSSLSYLSKLPIDKIKVDRSFVQGITSENSHAPIIAAVIAMAHSMDLPVTAEGVELEAQINFLKDRGCGMIQGFLISRPVSAEQISEILSGKLILKNLPIQPLQILAK